MAPLSLQTVRGESSLLRGRKAKALQGFSPLSATRPLKRLFLLGRSRAHSLPGVTGRYGEPRYIPACSESRPYTDKPGESWVA
jgi:hypothetical protein